tara:strand:- start:2439 stop:2738 length:300 start_codon:yes stop_codon:yes gene_type:complete
MNVFVGIQNKKDGSTKVFPARDYQKASFLSFMSSKNEELKFNYPGNIIFKLKKMNTEGLSGDYSRFCILENDKNEKHILSDDEKKLRGFIGWKNRIIMY